jgi:response regulator of citrate/malate metabolism
MRQKQPASKKDILSVLHVETLRWTGWSDGGRTVNWLAKKFNVSKATIRRRLHALAAQRKCHASGGGDTGNTDLWWKEA